MKNRAITLIFTSVAIGIGLLLSFHASPQSTIPIGITVNLDGTVQIATWEQLQTMNKLSDSIYYHDTGFDSPHHWNYLDQKNDLKNFEIQFLFLIHPLKPETPYFTTNPWEMNSYMDSSYLFLSTYTIPSGNSILNPLVVFIDSLTGSADTLAYELINPPIEEVASRYENYVDYEGDLGDTLETYFTQLLREYAFNNWEKHGIEISKPIHTLLVERDTVSDNEVHFDYKIKKLIFYNYTNNNLTSVIAFKDQYYGIEYDSLTYNKKNQLIAYHYNQIGDGGDEVFLEYDRKGRVVKTTSYSYLYHDHYDSDCPDCKRKSSLQTKTYFYGKDKLLNRIEVTYNKPVDEYHRTVEILNVKRGK